jgi:hypothetical protein
MSELWKRPVLIQGAGELDAASLSDGMSQVALHIQLNVPDLVGSVILKAPSWVWKETASCVVLSHTICREEQIIGWYHSFDILGSDGKRSTLELTHDNLVDILGNDTDNGDQDWQFLLPSPIP